jgi:hypothetical protein
MRWPLPPAPLPPGEGCATAWVRVTCHLFPQFTLRDCHHSLCRKPLRSRDNFVMFSGTYRLRAGTPEPSTVLAMRFAAVQRFVAANTLREISGILPIGSG